MTLRLFLFNICIALYMYNVQVTMDTSFQIKYTLNMPETKMQREQMKIKKIKQMIVQYIPWAVVSCWMLQQQAFHSTTQY